MKKNYRRADTGQFTTQQDNDRHPNEVVGEARTSAKKKLPGEEKLMIMRGDIEYPCGGGKGRSYKGRFMMILQGHLCDAIIRRTNGKQRKGKTEK